MIIFHLHSSIYYQKAKYDEIKSSVFIIFIDHYSFQRIFNLRRCISNVSK